MAHKLKIIYTPEGGSERDWVVDLTNPAWDVSFATEKATDWPWGVFVDRLQKQSAIALRALLWVLRKRDEPKLQLDSVKVDLDEIDFKLQCSRCENWIDDPDHACATEDEPEADGEGTEQDGGTPEPGEA